MCTSWSVLRVMLGVVMYASSYASYATSIPVHHHPLHPYGVTGNRKDTRPGLDINSMGVIWESLLPIRVAGR
jgi:hypothetical protein